MARGPSMLMPTRKLCALKKAAHSSSINVPLVWIVYSIVIPGLQYFCAIAMLRSKKSSPISVGSPPCQATFTSGIWCASINWRM